MNQSVPSRILVSVTAILSLSLAAVFFMGCTEQHDPTDHRNRIAKEAATANRIPVKLTEKGELPTGGPAKVVIGEKYKMLCASCHGATGAGDGAAAAAMNPKPRNLTDAAWQASVDDARIKTVIEKGGAAVGLSPLMTPWGASLPGDELQMMVDYVLPRL